MVTVERVLLLVCLLVLSGCSLAEVELQPELGVEASGTALRDDCRHYDELFFWGGLLGKVLALLAGASGLMALPLDDKKKKARFQLAGCTLVAGALAAGASFVTDYGAERFTGYRCLQALRGAEDPEGDPDESLRRPEVEEAVGGTPDGEGP